MREALGASVPWNSEDSAEDGLRRQTTTRFVGLDQLHVRDQT